jgi:RNA polymerase sigma-70 factor (ECF subfamily)
VTELPLAARQPLPGPDVTDRQVARGAGGVDAAETAFEAAVAPLYPALVRRLVLVLGVREDAEDIAQEAYERAFRGWKGFDGRDPRAWLYTIALRLAFNQLKRRRRWAAILERSPRAEWIDPIDPDLWSALSNIVPRARATLLLNALDGYTLAEIAVMLGEPEGTVSSRVSRARAVLRAALDAR